MPMRKWTPENDGKEEGISNYLFIQLYIYRFNWGQEPSFSRGSFQGDTCSTFLAYKFSESMCVHGKGVPLRQ